MKQRIVGILVLLILIAAIVALLFFGTRPGDKLLDKSGEPIVDTVKKAEVQLLVPNANDTNANQPKVQIIQSAGNQNAVQIDQTPRDAVLPTKGNNNQVVSNQFGQLAKPGTVQDNTQAATKTRPVTSASSASAVAAAAALSQASATNTDNVTPPSVAANTTTTAADLLANDSAPTTSSNVANTSPRVEDASNTVNSSPTNVTVSKSVKNSNKKLALAKKAKMKNLSLKKVPTLATANEASETPATNASDGTVVLGKMQDGQMVTNPKPTTSIVSSKVTKYKFAGGTGYAVKIGSFVAPPHADAILKQMKAKGYHAYKTLLSTKQGVMTQVLVGPVKTKQEATQLLKKMQAMHFKGFIVNVNKKAKTKSKTKVVKIKKT